MRFSLLLISFITIATVTQAQISSKITGGKWSDPLTWVGDVVPAIGDNVTIVAGSSVIIRTENGSSDPAACNSLTIDGTLTMGAGGTNGARFLNIADALLINIGGTFSVDGLQFHQVSIGGNFTNYGTFLDLVNLKSHFIFNGAGSQVIDGTLPTQIFDLFDVVKTGGTLTTSGTVTGLTVSRLTLTSGDFVAPASVNISGNLILTAGSYTAGANTSLGGNFTKDLASFVAGSGTLTFNGSGVTQQVIGGTSTDQQFNNISTSGSANLKAGNTNGVVTVVNGNLVVGDGTTLEIQRPITVKGTTTVGNGTSGYLYFSSLGGTKTFEGHVSVSIGATWDNDDVNENIHFNNGITNNGIFIAGSGLHHFEINSQSVDGVLIIPSIDVPAGIILTNNGTFSVPTSLSGGSGTLVQGDNAVLNIGGTSNITTLSPTGLNNTVNYTGADQTVKAVQYVNLGLSGSGIKTLNALTVTVSGNLVMDGTATTTTVSNLNVGGDLSIGTTASITNGTARTLTVTGSLTGGGILNQSVNSILNIDGASTLALINAAAAPNTVNYNAASPQVIPGSYNNLYLNQDSGVASLNGDITVEGTITLNKGNLELANGNLTLSAASTLSIATPSESRMIITSGTGEVRKIVSTTGSFTFPIGNDTGTPEYSPVTVDVTSATGFTSAFVGASVANTKFSSNNSATNFLTRYWNISQSGISDCIATVEGTYLPSDVTGIEGSTVAGQLTGTFDQNTNGWKKFSTLNGNLLTATGAILTGQPSVFTGISDANPTVSISGGDVTTCAGAPVSLTSTVSGIPTITYSWSPATGLSASDIADPIASPTVTTIYTLTIYDGNGVSAQATTTITVNPLPVIPSVANVDYCINASATALTATALADHTLQWYGTDMTGGTPSTTAPIPTTTIAGATIYYVSQKDDNTLCESERASITVTVSDIPTLPTVSDIEYCQNVTAVPLTATALTDHTLLWYGTDMTGGTSSTNAPTPSTSTAGITTYYVSQVNNAAGCEGPRASITVTVNALPTVSTPSTTLQVGNTMTASPVTGGTWISSDVNIATIDNAGLISAISTGSVTFTFTDSSPGCSSTTASVTVYDAPSVSVPSDKLCVGSSMTASPVTGGTWISSDPGIATIDDSGLITGISAGNVNFTFTETSTSLSNTTTTVTVNENPTVSTPSPTLQVGFTMTATPNSGGTWLSSDATIATIDNSGLITAVAAGSVTFTYTSTITGCSQTTAIVTVNDIPQVSVPSDKLCVGSSMTASPVTGGTWISSDPGIATIDDAGLITGVAAGNVTFTFTETATGLSNTTAMVTVNDLPTVIVPSDNLCVGSTMTLSPSIDGIWNSSDAFVATIDNAGLVTGISEGTVTFTFTSAVTGCSNTTSIVTINALPVLSAAAGVCVGSTITLNPTTGGSWISSDDTKATISNSGVVTGISAGSVTFTFTLTATGCSTATNAINVSPIPAKPTITTSNISSATPTLTSSSDTGNQWFRNGVALAGATGKTLTVSESGSYTVQVTTSGCTGPVSDAVDIVITGIENNIISGGGRIYPNPARESIQVDWSDFNAGVNIDVKIYDQVGRSVMMKAMATSETQLDVRTLIGGSYIFLARQEGKLMIQRFIKE